MAEEKQVQKPKTVAQVQKPKTVVARTKTKKTSSKKKKTALDKSLDFYRLACIFCIFAVFAISGLSIVFNVQANRRNAQANARIEQVQEESMKLIEMNRKTLIAGLYSVNKVIEEEIPKRATRLENYMREAKGIILERNQETDMSDDEMNNMLRVNFNFSEQYMVSPWLFLAFAAIESDFIKNAVSSAGARGIVQFMPSTMKIVLDEEYVRDMEFDPVWACKAWYKYITVISEAVDGDLKWTAAAYMSPTAIKFRNTDRTIEDFMGWIVKVSDNKESYPFAIEELYTEYLGEVR